MLRRFSKFFYLTLLILAWCSWELDDLQTPRVYCVAPGAGQLPAENGKIQNYPCILPIAAIHSGQSDERTVYIAEKSSSLFAPITTRTVPVYIMAEASGKVAISGLPADEKQIILYASRPLTGHAESIRLWDESSDAKHGWIEIRYEAKSSEDVFRHDINTIVPDLTQLGLEAQWIDDRLILSNANLFTVQQVETALVQAGIDINLLTVQDYSWSNAVLSQSNWLWMPVGALATMLLFIRASVAAVQSEFHCYTMVMRCTVVTEYAKKHTHRLLLKLILLTGTAVLCITLLHWLWQVRLILPTDFLPDGSIFNGAHYRKWWNTTFPSGAMSVAAQELSHSLIRSHLLAAAVSVVLLLIGTLLPVGKIEEKGAT